MLFSVLAVILNYIYNISPNNWALILALVVRIGRNIPWLREVIVLAERWWPVVVEARRLYELLPAGG